MDAKDAFKTDVRSLLREVREEAGLDLEPLGAFRKSGYAGRSRKARARTTI